MTNKNDQSASLAADVAARFAFESDAAPHVATELVIECGPGGAEHALAFAEARGLTVAGLNDVAKHTPGPWRYENRGGDRYIAAADGESLFCDMQYYPWCSNNEADWPLIAAAPDYHEAMTECLKPDHGYNIEYVSIPLTVWKKFLAAHAKAEGSR